MKIRASDCHRLLSPLVPVPVKRASAALSLTERGTTPRAEQRAKEQARERARDAAAGKGERRVASRERAYPHHRRAAPTSPASAQDPAPSAAVASVAVLRLCCWPDAAAAPAADDAVPAPHTASSSPFQFSSSQPSSLRLSLCLRCRLPVAFESLAEGESREQRAELQLIAYTHKK